MADLNAATAEALVRAPPDPVTTSVGMLRRVGAAAGVCSLTLIHPRVAITAAHCLSQLGEHCETLAQAAARLEVAFSSTTSYTDLVGFPIRDIAIAPGAFPSQISTCPTTPAYTCADSLEVLTDNSQDVALILLDAAVPASLAQPQTPITSIADSALVKYGAHIAVDADPRNPFIKQSPTGKLVGWGTTDDVCDVVRRTGVMEFESPYGTYDHNDEIWNLQCISSMGCNGTPRVFPTAACDANNMLHSVDFITLHRTQSSPGVFDGTTVAQGDSGGALLVSVARDSRSLPAQYLLGVISNEERIVRCYEPLPNNDYKAGVVPTFGAGVGSFIESQMHAWFDVVYTPIPHPRPVPPPVHFF